MFSAETGFRTVQLCFMASIDERLDDRIPIDERAARKVIDKQAARTLGCAHRVVGLARPSPASSCLSRVDHAVVGAILHGGRIYNILACYFDGGSIASS